MHEFTNVGSSYRGMSVAKRLLASTSCSHRKVISEYQKILAEASGIDDVQHLAFGPIP